MVDRRGSKSRRPSALRTHKTTCSEVHLPQAGYVQWSLDVILERDHLSRIVTPTVQGHLRLTHQGEHEWSV